jgi:hypothetical protein
MYKEEKDMSWKIKKVAGSHTKIDKHTRGNDFKLKITQKWYLVNKKV